MSRFVNPFPQFSQVVSGYLQPVSGGRLYFYVNGTSDLADIFTDAALTVPASNYQPLDGEGRMTQNVFIGTSVYRVRLADSNNATIWDKSNVTVADTAEIDGLIAELEALIASVSSDLISDNYAANGGMSVDNIDTAGTPVTLTTAYQETVTGYASAILTNVSAGTAKQSTVQIGESGYSLAYLGVSCTSAGVPAMRYRIASADAISLTGKTLTISLVVNHNVGAAVNYTIATYVANAADNFAAVTATGITSVTAVPTGADTTISLTSAFGDVTNGLEVIVSCAPNQAITTKNFYWSDVQCNISGVLLPFRPPVYREEKYRAIDPDSVATDADLQSLAERTYTSIVQVPVRVYKTTGTAATWTIPAGVTAFNVIVQGGGGGDLTNPGGASSVTYNSITYTANGGVQGVSSIGGAGGTTSGNGDENHNGQNGVARPGFAIGGSSLLGLGAAVQTGSLATGGAGAGGANGTSGGGGGGGGTIKVRLAVVPGEPTATYTVGAGGIGGSGGNGGDGVVIFEY